MKLDSSVTAEEKRRWKIVRTDNYAEVEGEILEADDETGKYKVKIEDDTKSDDLGPLGFRLVSRRR